MGFSKSWGYFTSNNEERRGTGQTSRMLSRPVPLHLLQASGSSAIRGFGRLIRLSPWVFAFRGRWRPCIAFQSCLSLRLLTLLIKGHRISPLPPTSSGVSRTRNTSPPLSYTNLVFFLTCPFSKSPTSVMTVTGYFGPSDSRVSCRKVERH